MGAGYWIVRGAIEALFAVPWQFLYQAPIGFLVAYLVLRHHASGQLRGRTMVILAALTGGGAALVLTISRALAVLALRLFVPAAAGRFFFPALAAFPALLLGWWVISHPIERYLDLDLESTRRIVGAIFGPTLLAWIGVGLLIIIINNP